MYRLYCRLFQTVMRIVTKFLPWRKPILIEGEGSVLKLPAVIRSTGLDNVLIVTDAEIVKLGLMDGFLSGLRSEGIGFTVYDGTVPNPTVENIEEALLVYREKHCGGIVAFGGGSPMDCAKGVGARVARPGKRIPKMRGILKVLRKLPPIFAVPTTAGTGSEATVSAIITDSGTHDKYAINDMPLIPPYAVLDPLLTVGLPPHITSTTGMDALTHAVEAYIGRSNTKETRELSRTAVRLMFENLYEAYANGGNLQARANMLKASHRAGIAFTRAYVGYAHAVAHALGGMYSIPHGLANAVILPHVLEYYGAAVEKQLAELADVIGEGGSGDSPGKKAKRFIDAVKALNARMGIPDTLTGIRDEDIPLMVDRALKEANPLYPVPKILSRKDLGRIFSSLKEKTVSI